MAEEARVCEGIPCHQTAGRRGTGGDSGREASVGWEEDVFYQGAKCGTVTRYDSGLMQLLLKGFLPEKYGNKTEISGPQGAPVQARIEIVFVRPGDVTGSGGTDAGL